MESEIHFDSIPFFRLFGMELTMISESIPKIGVFSRIYGIDGTGTAANVGFRPTGLAGLICSVSWRRK